MSALDLYSSQSYLLSYSIIAVPGYGTPPVQTWNMESELQDAAISVNSLASLHMYIYQPGYEVSDDFTWDSFLKVGNDLAEELARIATEVYQYHRQTAHSITLTRPIVPKQTNYLYCTFSWRYFTQKGMHYTLTTRWTAK